MVTLLIIENNMSHRHLCTRTFRQEGFQVFSAGSGEEALRLAEEKTPDLVILDIQLPGMDGLECMGQLLAKFPWVPIIINTTSQAYQDHFISWCAAAYVSKS